MKALGIRCWKEKLAFVVLEDDGEVPVPLARWHGAMPKPLGPERLDWVYQEIKDAIRQYSPDRVAIRVVDAGAKQVDPFRAEADGAAQLASVHSKITPARMGRQQMASALGATAAGAWGAYPKADPFISSFPVDEREAAMAARVALIKG